MLDTIGLVLISGPVLWVLMRWYNLGSSVFDARKRFWTKGGFSSVGRSSSRLC